MDKIVIITGGTRGIGRKLVDILIQAKFKVVTCARSPSAIKELRNQYSSNRLFAKACDISSHQAVSSFISDAVSKFGKIDALINNAAISKINQGQRIPFESISYESWKETLATNLDGAFSMCRLVTPYMIEQRGGHIINISSALERTGGGIASADYIASKAGLVGLSKALAHERGKYNIRVNTISPGRTATDMVKDVEDNNTWAKANIPLQRLGQAEDIASIAAFLLSQENCFINGANIDCNGGWVIH